MNQKLDKSKIPYGEYCYTRDKNGKQINCPYWDSAPKLALKALKLRGDDLITEQDVDQFRGYCHYLQLGDWMEEGTFLLWPDLIVFKTLIFFF